MSATYECLRQTYFSFKPVILMIGVAAYKVTGHGERGSASLYRGSGGRAPSGGPGGRAPGGASGGKAPLKLKALYHLKLRWMSQN